MKKGGEFGSYPIGDPQVRSSEVTWKGSDLHTVGSDRIVNPNSVALVPMLVDPETLPDLSNFQPLRLLASTKSRLAQLGLEVAENVGEWVMAQAQENIERDGFSRSFVREVLIRNHSARPIKIESGSPIFRFYVRPPFIEGSDLKRLVIAEDVVIDGNQGKDWDYVYEKPHDKRNQKPYGIAVRINSGNRLWIPSSEKGSPLSVKELQQERDYRKYIGSKYQPAPRSSVSILWIGETVNMKLSPLIDAELEKTVFSNLSRSGGAGIQTAARLIDGGKTVWEVRVEVLGPTDSSAANFVVFRFMRADNTQIEA